MTIDYEQFYEAKPTKNGWDNERSARWLRLGAAVKADHVEQLLRRGGECSGWPASVLEVGCGDGSVLSELATRGFGPDLTGVEISRTAADLARRQPGVRRVETFDGDTLPFDDGSFDLVLATHVLEHVDRPIQLLREMARVARRLVLVEVPLERNLTARRPRARALARHVGHVQKFDRSAVRQLIAEAGLTRVAELSDPLPRHVRAFHDGAVRGSVKWVIRVLLVRLPRGERLMTVHYAALGRRPPTITAAAPS